MAAMPGCDPLECRVSAHKRGFVQIGGHKLERDWQSGRCRDISVIDPAFVMRRIGRS